MTLANDELEDIAYGIVIDYLAEGPEYITFSEVLEDNASDEFDESDVERLALYVREHLTNLTRKV